MNIKHGSFSLLSCTFVKNVAPPKINSRQMLLFAVVYSLMFFPTALLAQPKSPTDIPPTDIPPSEPPPTTNTNPVEGSQPTTTGNPGVSLSPNVENAVNLAIANVIGALNSGNLTTQTGTPIPNSTQQILLAILTADPNTFEPTTPQPSTFNLAQLLGQSKESQQISLSALINDIENTLTSASGGVSLNLARNLASNLLGLLACDKINPTVCKIDAAKLLAAVAAYNAVIKASSEEFLRNPPITLLAIRAILSDLVNAAIAADAELKH